MEKPVSLYQQFDARLKAQGAALMVDHSCAGLLNGIGSLLALGIPPVAVEEFLAEALKQAIAASKPASPKG
jgi:hypothetical protein